MDRPLVSIITINYKQALVTNELLESLQTLTYPNVEVLVVDNNSGEDDVRLVDTSHENVRLIKSETNLGFAGGNNLGILHATGKYILLLNNDTVVMPGFLEPMVELLEKSPTIGAVSPKIRFFYDFDLIQYAGYSRMNPFSLRMHAHGYHQTDNGQFNEISKTQFAHGCAMMVPRTIIEKVGIMPEDYFLYYEELDWCTQIKKSGYDIYYQPLSVVFHKESVSVQKHSPLKTYYLNRNRILYMRRNLSWFFLLIATTYLVFVSIPKNMAMFLFKKQWVHLKAYKDALVWNVLH